MVRGPATNGFKQSYWSKALNWSQGFDEGRKPKSGKLRLNLHGTCFGWKISWFSTKNSAKRRAPDLENQESGYGPRYGPTQGSDLLKISRNWFLGNWTLDPPLKWAEAKSGVSCFRL